MLTKNKIISLILFFLCAISLSFQEQPKNWTIGNNSINILTYSSSLTEEQRENYYYWIGLRNSFYYSQNSNQLEKLVKYFTPEEETYYKDLYNFSLPGLILTAGVFVIFLVYLVKRFLLKGCKGPKNVTKSYNNTTYFFIAFGCILGLLFHTLSIYNAAHSNANIHHVLDKVEEQKELMKKIYDDDIKGNKKVAIEKDCKPIFNMDLSLYGEEIIDKDFQKLQNKLDNFTKDLKSIQVHKFNYQITSAALFVVISSIGIAGYWIRREYIPLISSILLLLFAAPIFAMAGLETTYTFLSIDFCSTIGNSIISGITPSEDTGLGSYLSCPSKETMRTLSTAIYQYMIDFDTIYNYVKFTLENNTFFDMLKIGNDKRNNTYFMELRENLTLLNLTSENPEEEKRNNQTRDNMIHGVSLFIDLNYILAGLLSMTSCFTAKNIINYIEENYCYENHGYMFRNILFSILTGLGFIITSAGINKLIIVMRNRYSRALRGKKEFNTDIINEDDDY